MTGSANSRRGEQVHSLKRRSLLGLLTAAPLGLSVVLLAACSGSIPPRQHKRPPSHISGGKGGMMGGGRGAGGAGGR